MFKRKTRWHKISESKTHLEDRIPLNQASRFRVEKKKVCMARNSNGFFALDDKCPHQGASLSRGYCSDEGFVECPWHKNRFDLTTGRDRAGAGDYVETYPLEFRNDGVYLGIEYTAFTLFSWLDE